METIDIVAAEYARSKRSTPDYATWSIEELRLLARQLRVREAAAMTRDELLDLLAPPAHPQSECRPKVEAH